MGLLRGIAQRETHGVLARAEPSVLNAVLAQDGPRVVADRAQPFFDDLLAIDFQQKRGAALKVEAERDLVVGQEVRKPVGGVLRNEVRHGERYAEHDHQPDQCGLPSRIVKHRSAPFG